MKVLKFIKDKLIATFYAVLAFVVEHKITSAVILSAVAGVTAAAIIVSSVLSAPVDAILSSVGNISDNSSETTVLSEPENTVSEPEETVSSEETPVSSEQPTISSNPTPPTPPTPPTNTQYNYNSNMSYDNNVFLDALKYTGYKTDPAMWGSYGNYVLCSQKRGRGWLSNITYDDYGRSKGYEVNAQGKPDIAYFEQKGLVCASYVAYVYFNYLPNVAGIDTSMLPKAGDPVLANEWYLAAQQWVNLGYSRYINFTANDGGSIYQDLKMTPEEEIPIGSLIFLCDWYNRTNWSTHVSIYAGKVNGYHWVTHVGNENGPELCAIERMNRLPHPQWMLAIITPPSNIRFSAAVEVTVKDADGKPMKDVSVSVKRKSNGVVTELGKTDSSGKVTGDGLSYDEYEIIQTVPNGYTCENSAQTMTFTTANNSLNSITFTNKKQEEKKTEKPTESSKNESVAESDENSSDTTTDSSKTETAE